MKIIKSLQASLLTKTFQYNHKHFFVFSSLWGFRLDSGDAVLEQDLWQTIGESIGKDTLLDEAMPKDQAEFLAFGSAISVNKKPVPQLDVIIEFAGLRKHLVVYGDRYWKGVGPLSYPSEPTRFTSMALNYQHTFGAGSGHYNTSGFGCGEIEKNGLALHWLANIENASYPVTTKSIDYSPVSFLPLNQSWPMQQALVGTYDDEYLQNHMPGLAADIDWSYFNVAAQDQRFERYLIGDEGFSIRGMHLDKEVIQGVLPSIKPRGFIVRKQSSSIEEIALIVQYQTPNVEQFEELTFNLDTVLFFPNCNLGVVIHRATAQIHHPQAQDLEGLLLAHQGLGEEQKPLAFYFAEYCKRCDPAQSYKYLLDSRSLLPNHINCGFLALQQSIPNQNAMVDNMSSFAGGQKESAQQQVDQAIEQQIAELKLLGKNDDADKLLAATKQKMTSLPVSDEAKKLNELADKILPGAKDGKLTAQNIDLSTLNLEAMQQMQEAMKEMAQSKKQQTIDEIKAQITRLKKESAYVQGVNASIEKLAFMLEQLTLPLILPRPSNEALKQIRTALKQADNFLNESMTVEVPSLIPLNDEQQKQLILLQNKVSSAENDKKLDTAFEFIKDSYLKGAHFIEHARSPHAGREEQISETLKKELTQQLNFSTLDFAFCTLKNLDFSGCTLATAYFEFTQLSYLIFKNTDLRFVNFAHATVSHTVFEACIVNTVNFGAGKFKQCHFKGLDFNEVTFAKSTFIECTFSDCLFGERQDAWLETELTQCSFTRCQLPKLNFIELQLTYTQFNQCDLSECNFIKPNLTHSAFVACTFKGTNFVMAQLPHVSFKQSKLENARFVGGCQMQHTCFDQAMIHASNLRDCDLSQASFKQADISGSDFGSSLLNDADFSHSIAQHTQFIEAKLRNALFLKADLFEANLMNADLRSGQFKGANLYSVSFLNATIGKTDFSGANLDNTLLQDWRPIFE
ncbi:DUF2169 domain-containing protein [Pseudoalteromonas tunicata]|uniref:DUF2169 domain-containing protein n=1 Tax=Pseudoalteromonas tunicata TaxID=314281 RepID=UPI00273F8649|nr:DUF2169 domain-containing protein [Pseudoalteromonas tunicata]MDP5214968.1 DUF2169 domain-containing protein [Pseudoalteromonas tunicata]